MDEVFKYLAGAGTAGAVLVWFMYRFTPAMEAHRQEMRDGFNRMSAALDRSTRANLIRLVASPLIAADVKTAAAGIIQETEAADEERRELDKEEK